MFEVETRSKKVVQAMKLTAENTKKVAAKDRLQLVKLQGQLALLEVEEEIDVLTLPKDMLENWEEFAMHTMQEAWEANLKEVQRLMEILPTSCKPQSHYPPQAMMTMKRIRGIRLNLKRASKPEEVGNKQ